MFLSQFVISSARNSLKFNKINTFSLHSMTTKEKKMENVSGRNKEGSQKSLHVAVIGVPNAGKSTFINNLINHRVCPTSSKVHTTRHANTAICTTKNTQLVLYDTPGLVTPKEIKKHNLDQSFKTAYRKAIRGADVIAVLHDVSNSWTRNELHTTVLDTLKEYPEMPSFLVMNKIDTLKSKRILLDLIRILTQEKLRSTSGKTSSTVQQRKQRVSKLQQNDDQVLQKLAPTDDQQTGASGHKREVSWQNFEDVFLVSSLTADGLNDIHDFLIKNAKQRDWRYPGTSFTDETPENLIVESVRARLLDYLPQEIPYNLKSEIEFYTDEKTAIFASVIVSCPTARIERLICGEANGKLRQITERVTSDLVETFGKPISLTIVTTSKKDEKKEAINKA